MNVMVLLTNPFCCHKQLIEEALGNPDGDRTAWPPCFKCSVFNVNFKMWLSVCKPGVRLVIFDVFTSGSLISGYHTMENVSDALRAYPEASKHLFTVRSVKQPLLDSIHKVLFILIVDNIIEMKYEKGCDNNNKTAYVQLCLAKVSELDAQGCLVIDRYWSNISLKDPLLDYS